jgi:hypothetical protein
MPTRQEVYAAIDSERDYQDRLSDDRTEHHDKRTIGEYLTMLRYYVREADDNWTKHAGDAKALDSVRKVAAIVVHCMEDTGIALRTTPTKKYALVLDSPPRMHIYQSIDDELRYQDEKFPNRQPHKEPCTVGENLTLIEHYLRWACDHFVERGQESGLVHESLRKLLAVAVRCMEVHGAPERPGDPPKSPWEGYIDIFPYSTKTAGQKWWVRHCDSTGIYRWLHPNTLKWVEEPAQIGMPLFSSQMQARAALAQPSVPDPNPKKQGQAA